jgi:hypothetical protein
MVPEVGWEWGPKKEEMWRREKRRREKMMRRKYLYFGHGLRRIKYVGGRRVLPEQGGAWIVASLFGKKSFLEGKERGWCLPYSERTQKTCMEHGISPSVDQGAPRPRNAPKGRYQTQ